MAKGGMMIVNADLLDARRINEDNYKDYTRIIINSDLVLSTRRANDAMAGLPLIMNCDRVIELPDECEYSLLPINGDYRISGDVSAKPNTILKVDGDLVIEPNADGALNNFSHILVDGNLVCPSKLMGELHNLVVSGETYTYTGDCDIKITEAKLKVDRIFVLRAKPNTIYLAEKAVFITEPDIDVKSLVEKGVRFLTKEIFVRDEYVEASIDLVGEETKLSVIQEDMPFLVGSLSLDERFIETTDGYAYINGDFIIKRESAHLLPKIKKVVVKGTVKLAKSLESEFSKLDVTYDNIKLKKGRDIVGQVKVRIDKALLDASPDGISVTGVTAVTLSKDITPEEIIEKLDFTGIAKIKCTEEQEAAVAAVSEGVAKIGNSSLMNEGMDEENGFGVKDALGEVFGGSGPMDIIKGFLGSKIINADEYVL